MPGWRNPKTLVGWLWVRYTVITVLPFYAGVRRNYLADTRHTRNDNWFFCFYNDNLYNKDNIFCYSRENSAKTWRVLRKTHRLFQINRHVLDKTHRVLETESKKIYVCWVLAISFLRARVYGSAIG